MKIVYIFPCQGAQYSGMEFPKNGFYTILKATQQKYYLIFARLYTSRRA